MDQATIALTAVTGLIALVFLGFLIWGIKSGQFRDVEETKYQVFWKQKPADHGKAGQAGACRREVHRGKHS